MRQRTLAISDIHGERERFERLLEEVRSSGKIITPEQVADALVAVLAAERFLILPHPQVGTFWAQKANDGDGGLAGVRRLLSR